MRYLHNRLHGYGTVSGLEVDVTRGRVRVSPGMGIDVLGREIVVTAPLIFASSRTGTPDDGYETSSSCGTRPLSAQCHGPDGSVDFTRWIEQPELVLVARGRAAREGLVLARLTRTNRGAVSVDTSVRQPLGHA